MLYIVEFATQTFRFKNANKAMVAAELLAKHKEAFSPWTPTIKVIADKEDREEDREDE